jgi:hypothetical protein
LSALPLLPSAQSQMALTMIQCTSWRWAASWMPTASISPPMASVSMAWRLSR